MPFMQDGCRLYVVNADEIPELKTNPASALGRAVLAGLPVCHLPNSWQTLRLLLSEPQTEPAEPSETGYLRGTVLSHRESAKVSARLFDPDEVNQFHRFLSPWNEASLSRQFDQQLVACDSFDLLRIDRGGCFDSAGWEEQSIGNSIDNWTIEQAEEFESLAETLSRLRKFIAGAAFAGQAIVWLMTAPESLSR